MQLGAGTKDIERLANYFGYAASNKNQNTVISKIVDGHVHSIEINLASEISEEGKKSLETIKEILDAANKVGAGEVRRKNIEMAIYNEDKRVKVIFPDNNAVIRSLAAVKREDNISFETSQKVKELVL